jgi:excisionase family DNA binding protein
MTDRADDAGAEARPLPPEVKDRTRLRHVSRARALQSALRKRADGVPSYTVPEAAALCSMSPEQIYRLVRADEFPSIRVGKARYSIPASAIEQLLGAATAAGACVDVREWAKKRLAGIHAAGGAA